MFNWYHVFVLKFKNKTPEKAGVVVVSFTARNKENAEVQLNKLVDWNKYERYTYGTSNWFGALAGFFLPFHFGKKLK